MDLLQQGDGRQAARAFEEVERQHPYSEWATRAQLMSAYAFYEANDYDEAVAAAQRFIDLHPGNKDVAYAYYLIGVSHYEQISDVGRDQKMTELALDAFDELIRRFPESRYARDAELKADLARDHLAGKEMEIGRYYLRRGEYVAAINRFSSVINRYQTTTHVRRGAAPADRVLPGARRAAGSAPDGLGAGLQLPGQRVVSGQLRSVHRVDGEG